MSVKIAFEHEGREFILTRHVQASHRPARDADLEKILTLEIDGNVQPTERVREIVSGILHEDISRFFLFDGEMLGEYEDLLNNPDRAPAIVRRSIEQILGLPALELAAKDLEELRTEAERRQLQEARRNNENTKLIKDAQQKEDELAATDRDIAQYQDIQRQLEEQRSSLRAQRDRFSEIQTEVKLLDEKEAQLHEIAGIVNEMRLQCRIFLQQHWWMPLEKRIQMELESAEKADTEERTHMREMAAIRQRVEGIQKILSGSACDLCRQDVSPSATHRLGADLEELRHRLVEMDASASRSHRAREQLSLLRQFAGSQGLTELHNRETEIRRLRMSQDRLARQIDEIEERVRQHERVEVQRIERQYDECITQLKDVSRSLEMRETQRSAVHAALERLRQRIRGLPKADRRLAAEAIALDALERLFEMGIQSFRDEVRRDVEIEATRIHQSLTSEEGYDQLRITEQYGLVLVNKEGRTIHQRSAGSEQVLALSLIGALNRCATREAPVVMDTPFGRLDVGHRANILKFAPSFGPQVVLLVQSGEFDRSRDMENLAGKVSREVRIQRDGASDRSVIESLREI